MAKPFGPGAARAGAAGASGSVKRAADAPRIARREAKGERSKATRLVMFETADGPRWAHIGGRELWALCALVAARERGVTPIEHVGPRWSDYVFKLRARGLVIETIREKHGGDFPGHHARYVLRSVVALGGGA